MKATVSLPDNIFEIAEKTAQRLGMSRSEFYTNAIKSFLEKFQEASEGENTTKALDLVYGKNESGLDSALAKIQTISIEEEKW
jgi:metal-responsive CopG/Arc/MetJ family transcriptional regulator